MSSRRSTTTTAPPRPWRFKYALKIADGAFKDLAGNAITGFSTEALTPLTSSVDSLAPKKTPGTTEYGAGSMKLYVAGSDITSAVGATSASYKENLLLKFSEPVRKHTTADALVFTKLADKTPIIKASVGNAATATAAGA